LFLLPLGALSPFQRFEGNSVEPGAFGIEGALTAAPPELNGHFNRKTFVRHAARGPTQTN